jgi:hypothetical protein
MNSVNYISERDYPRLRIMVSNIFLAIDGCRGQLQDNDPDWDTIDDFLSSMSSDIVFASDTLSTLPLSMNPETIYIVSVQIALRCYDTMLRSVAIADMSEEWSVRLKRLAQGDYLPVNPQTPSTMRSVMGAMDPGAYDA